MRVPRAHHWFVIVWVAATLVAAVIIAVGGADEDIDTGNSVLGALALVVVSGILLAILALWHVRLRDQSGYPPSVYGLRDFIDDSQDE